MLQKCTILGFVLLLAGGAAYGWLYNKAQKERQQIQSQASANVLGSQEYIEKYGRWYQLSPERQAQLLLELDKERKSKSVVQLDREQQARLAADLDKLAAGQVHPGDIADFLYGPGWESQVDQYRAHKEQMETARSAALVCLFAGAVVLGGCALLWFLRLLVRVVRRLRHRSAEPQPGSEPSEAQLTDIEMDEGEAPAVPEEPVTEEQPKQRRRVLARAEAAADSVAGASASEQPAGLEDLFSVTTPALGPCHPAPALQPMAAEGGVALLLADEQSSPGEWSAQDQWSSNSTSGVPSVNASQEQRPMRRSALQPPNEESVTTVEKSLKEQAEDLQKQIAEFKEVAQDVKQVTRQQSEPLGDTLKALTQQVSAIREYAASQQGRVEKLQDGYDWGIIRTFCLRVIRCIDNLEGRLAELPKEDGAVQHLEEVRDELLFALESSGVEQFQPELNSEFHGQEKLAEALKEKQPAKKPEQAGKIARVIRPGYRYVVDDDNYRVVRTAQVKVYG